MAESLGNITKHSENQPWGMTMEDFQEKYLDELQDLVNDSDNIVRIKALISVGQLVGYLDET